jgi:hypothetical protein
MTVALTYADAYFAFAWTFFAIAPIVLVAGLIYDKRHPLPPRGEEQPQPKKTSASA